MRSRSLLGVLLVIGIITGGCTESSEPQPDTAVGGLTWSLCDSPPASAGGEGPSENEIEGHFFCGSMTFSGRSMNVLAHSNQSADPLKNRNVVVYHPGGPGVSPTQLLRMSPPAVDLSRSVIVTWDGITSSADRGTCGKTSGKLAVDRPSVISSSDLDRLVEECMSTNSSAASAQIAVDELERLRLVVGIPQIDLLMYSYGTAVGQAYLDRYPANVRRAVLDGPFGLDVTWDERKKAVGGALALAYEDLSKRCDEFCNPDTAGLLRSGYPDLRDKILAGRPKVGSGRQALTGTVLDQAMLMGLRGQEYYEDLLSALESGLSGKGTAIWAFGERYSLSGDRPVYYATVCHDLAHPMDTAMFTAPSPLVATWASDLAICAAVESAERPTPIAISGEAGGSAGPEVVVIASTADIVTPAALATGSTDLRRVATICVRHAAGHTSSGQVEVDKAVSEFLAGQGSLVSAEVCDEAVVPHRR